MAQFAAPALIVRRRDVIVPAYRFTVGPLQQRIILWALAAQRPCDGTPLRLGALYKDELFDFCYGDDPEGGPEDPSAIINVEVLRLNRVLRECGWEIVNLGAKRLALRQAVAP